ncbi:MAG: hypothetical protein HIU83_15170 [Proteobacteria bacterium]|nr:hypothetical protein [Pseudomonadota bacterium]
MTNLSAGIKTRNYADDKIITGPNLSATTFNNLKKSLPETDQRALVGWVKTGR